VNFKKEINSIFVSSLIIFALGKKEWSLSVTDNDLQDRINGITVVTFIVRQITTQIKQRLMKVLKIHGHYE
jgi:hypothetical protein